VRAGGDPADLPPSLRDVLLSRIDSLSPAGQLLLRTASVAGRRVPERLLAAVTDLDESALFTALRETVESHLLVVDDTGLGYAFRHALARDAVYEDMLPGERVRLHAAYGTALAREPGLADDLAAVPAALAHHWYAALDLPLALSASITAARRAMASYAPAEAQQHLERALQIWPRVPDAEQRTGLDQSGVSRLTADAAHQAGAVDRAVSLLDQALAELPGDGDAVRRALLLDRRAHALRDVGHEDVAIAALHQAMTLLPADQVTRAHAVVLASLASSLMRLGRWDEVDRLTARALGTFPVGIFAGTLLQLRAELAAERYPGRRSGAALEAGGAAAGRGGHHVQPDLRGADRAADPGVPPHRPGHARLRIPVRGDRGRRSPGHRARWARPAVWPAPSRAQRRAGRRHRHRGRAGRDPHRDEPAADP
jgi:tetratricopeptide (TPR) repeat protein